MDEARQRYIDVMGEEYGILFYHCYQSICHLRITWRHYVSLFGESKERFDFIYSISGILAHTIDFSLMDSTLLGIRRLTDAAEFAKARNVSIRGFAPLFIGTPDEISFNHQLDIALSSSRTVQTWANKRIAHSDFDVIDGKAKLPDLTRLDITKAIDDIASVIKWIARKRIDTAVSTIPSIGPDDESWFLRSLFEGVKVSKSREKRQQEAFRSGRFLEVDPEESYPGWLLPRTPPDHDID